MSRKRLVTMLGAACASLLLAACIPGLSDDGSQYFGRGDEGESNSERQTMEAFIDETVPRYMNIVEDVAVEAGGTLGVGAKPDISGCGPTSNGFEIRLGLQGRQMPVWAVRAASLPILQCREFPNQQRLYRRWPRRTAQSATHADGGKSRPCGGVHIRKTRHTHRLQQN